MGSKADKKTAIERLTKARGALEHNQGDYDRRNDDVIDAEKAAKAAGVRVVSMRGWNYEIEEPT